MLQFIQHGPYKTPPQRFAFGANPLPPENHKPPQHEEEAGYEPTTPEDRDAEKKFRRRELLEGLLFWAVMGICALKLGGCVTEMVAKKPDPPEQKQQQKAKPFLLRKLWFLN